MTDNFNLSVIVKAWYNGLMGGKGDVMNELAIRAGQVKNEMAAILAAYPSPDKWTPEMRDQAVQFAALLDTAQKMIASASVAGIDWKAERENFLNDARSVHTRRAYGAALGKLEEWTGRKGINPFELTTSGADNFIRFLKEDSEGKPRAAASVRRDIAAVSAFYTHLERYHHDTIKNPVRGTRIRPPHENKKDTIIPRPENYRVIIATLPPIERAIIVCLALRGLRAGALPTLELKNGKYHGKSKGKILKENNTAGITLPQEALRAIKAAKLDIKKPFAKYSADAIERRVNRRIGELYQAGKIPASYSAHDFRHYFSVEQYKKKKDIYRVSMLLGHANIAITQTYLKSLDVKL
jgi:integrase